MASLAGEGLTLAGIARREHHGRHHQRADVATGSVAVVSAELDANGAAAAAG